MKPRRRKWLGALVFGFSQICFHVVPAVADPDAARRHYERGLVELKAGRLSNARESFEEAYRLSPHYMVLYNLGMVAVDLNDHDAARSYFERYLEQGGDAIAPVERARVRELIEKSREASSAEGAASADDERQAATETRSEPAPANVAPRVPRDEGARPAHPTRSPSLPSGPGASYGELARERQTTLSVTLGATGALLAAVGTGVVVWNEGRHADYLVARDELGAPPPREVSTQEELDRVVAYTRASEKNQAELASIQRFDVVGWTLVGVGAGLVATGAILYVTRTPDSAVGMGVHANRVRLSLSF